MFFKGYPYGHEITETNPIPITNAYLTRYAMRKAVPIPPQKIANHSYRISSASYLEVIGGHEHARFHTFGLDIWPLSHIPVCALSFSKGQPPRDSGVEPPPPVMAPIPAE